MVVGRPLGWGTQAAWGASLRGKTQPSGLGHNQVEPSRLLAPHLELRKRFDHKYQPRAMPTQRVMGTLRISEITRERMGQGPGQNPDLQ